MPYKALSDEIKSIFTQGDLDLFSRFGMRGCAEFLNNYCCDLKEVLVNQIALTQRLRSAVNERDMELKYLLNRGNISPEELADYMNGAMQRDNQTESEKDEQEGGSD